MNNKSNDSDSELRDSHSTQPIYSETEASLVSAVLRSGKATVASAHVSDTDFRNPNLGAIFKACLEAEKSTSPTSDDATDFELIASILRRDKKLNAVGGTNALFSLVESHWTPSTRVEELARLVRGDSDRRALHRACNRAITTLREGGSLDAAYLELAPALNKDNNIQDSVDLSDAVLGFFEEMEKPIDRNPVTIGLRSLDSATVGLKAGQLITVLGRPGMGKTAFAITALNANATNGKHGLFFTLEMSRHEIAARVLSSNALVNSQKLKARATSHEEFQRVVTAAQSVSVKPGKTIIVEGDKEIQDIVSIACRTHAKSPIDYMIIDHLHQISQPVRVDRTAHLDRCVRELKSLAKRLRVPIILFAQVRRDVETREDKRPRAGDGEWCATIEQVSDIIVGLYREEYYHATLENRGLARIELLKHRDGATGASVFKFEKSYTIFTERNDDENETQEFKAASKTTGKNSYGKPTAEKAQATEGEEWD